MEHSVRVAQGKGHGAWGVQSRGAWSGGELLWL